MARYRPTPTCPYCGKPIAKAVYKDQSKIPQMFRIIGDTFLRWEPIKHSCKGSCEAKKEMRKAIDDSMAKIKADAKKSGRKLPPFMK